MHLIKSQQIQLSRYIAMKYTQTLLFTFLLLLTYQTQNMQSTSRLLQSTTRSYSQPRMCTSDQTRTNLITESDRAASKINKQAFKASMGISGNDFMSSVVKSTDGIITGLTTNLPTVQSNLGIYIGPFVLGLLVLILSAPFLCCCCCCPNSCPSKCCQKPDQQQYTKCQLIWPTVILVAAFVFVIIGGAMGINKGVQFELTYKSLGCAVGYTLDDFIYGNYSSKGNYYAGVLKLHKAAEDLWENRTLHETKFNNLKFSVPSNAIPQVYAVGASFLNEFSKIPDGSTSGSSMAAFGYKHFDGTGTAGDVASTFPTVLGTTNPASPSGEVYKSYSNIKKINEALKSVGESADFYSALIAVYEPRLSMLTSFQDSRDAYTESAKIDKDLAGGDGDMYSVIESAVKSLVSGFGALFGVCIGFGVVGIIAALMMTFCDKFSCRYFVYILCVILMIIGIFAFFFAIIFSLFGPLMYFTCDFIQLSVSNAVTYNRDFKNAFPAGKTGRIVSSYLQVCLPDGNGDYSVPLGGVNYSYVIGNVTNIGRNIQLYNAVTINGWIDDNFTQLENVVKSYYYTDIFDFNSGTDLDIMRDVATPANHACTANGFAQDNWVPSTRQTTIACANTVETASATQCPSSTQIIAGRSGAPGSSCFGCMDSVKVLLNAATDQISNINSRYNDPTCTAWKTKFNNLWTQYYSIKKTNYPPILTNIAAARSVYTTSTVGYHDVLLTLQIAVTAKQAQLNTVPLVYDIQSGLISGMHCGILGEDILMATDVLCTRMINLISAYRPAFAILSFAILFVMFCGTCAGVRSFKHMERSKNRIQTLNPKNIHIYDQASIEHLGKSR